MPRTILYDNTRLAVARILGDGTRERSRSFAELQSHYVFQDRFGRPGKGNDKGKVEGLVGYARRNFLVPVPVFASFEELNAHLEECCLARLDHQLRGHTGTIGERLERDLAALQPRPPSAYDACDHRATRVSALSLVRYDRNDYSVPTAYGHRAVLVKGYVDGEACYRRAIEVARAQRSKTWELRATIRLARLWTREGERHRALDMLAPIYGWFTEGFDTADLKGAKALLYELQ